MNELLWVGFGFILGSLGRSFLTELGKDIYQNMSLKWKAFRSPFQKNYDPFSNLIYYTNKPKRFWHKQYIKE